MINLLPPDYKNNIIYARRNLVLRKWILVLLVALIGCLAIVAGGYIYMDQSISSKTKQIAEAKANLKSENIDETRQELDEISSNTKLILQVLSKEILFSGLIRQLGASLPANTALEGINIANTDGGIVLKAVAQDINAATQIQVNLSDPGNKIFQKADIENINCTEGQVDTIYPCSVQLRVLFAQDNPYIYIQSNKTGGNNP